MQGHHPGMRSLVILKKSPNPAEPRKSQGRAVVLHPAPTKYKAGQTHRWIEEDNKGLPKIMRIHWLAQEHRRARNLAPSLVSYMRERIDLNRRPQKGKRMFRHTEYDRGR